MNIKPAPLHAAFSLIEVIIFVSILSILFVGAAGVTSFMYKQNQLQVIQLIATHQSEELYQWLRGERTGDWDTFVSHLSNGNTAQNTVFCFSDADSDWSGIVATVSSCPYSLDSRYRRSATFHVDSLTAPTQVNVVISTDWNEAGHVRSKIFTSTFTQW